MWRWGFLPWAWWGLGLRAGICKKPFKFNRSLAAKVASAKTFVTGLGSRHQDRFLGFRFGVGGGVLGWRRHLIINGSSRFSSLLLLAIMSPGENNLE